MKIFSGSNVIEMFSKEYSKFGVPPWSTNVGDKGLCGRSFASDSLKTYIMSSWSAPRVIQPMDKE